MKYTESSGNAIRCPQCGGQVASGLLVCPGCGALIHADELKQLAAEAQEAKTAGDASTEIAAWRSAQELLPAGSLQHTQVLNRVVELSKLLDSGAVRKTEPVGAVRKPTPIIRSNHVEKTPGKWGAKSGLIGGLVMAGLFLLKFKSLIVIALTKGKLLLLGLTKGSTFFSMLLSFGFYWSLWGWKFAAGLVVGIYIHEMGHVAALVRLGIKASAPMFIPGLGALVRLKQYPADAREDARIGLAGPIYGLGASIAAFLIYLATASPMWAAIAQVNAWINMFNLIPISPLDGGRGFRVLLKWQRFTIAAAFGLGYLATRDGLLALLGIVAIGMAIYQKEPGPGDRRAFIEYLGLIAVLAALLMIPIPGMP